MFIPSLVVMTILGLISALGTTYFFDRLGTSSLYSSPSQPDAADLEKQWSSLFGLYAQSGVNSILTMFASSILTGLLIVTVSRTILGRKASLSDVWQRTKPRVWALIGQAVIIQLVFTAVLAAAIGVFFAFFFGLRIPDVDSASPDDAVGTILLTILGLFLLVALVGLGIFALYCKLSLAPAALILENVGVFEGISRSWALTRGYFWRVVGIQILSLLIMSLASAIVTTPISMLSAGVFAAAAPSARILALGVSVLLGNIVTAATLPFDSAVNALIYTDLRMRSEGLDVELRRAAGV